MQSIRKHFFSLFLLPVLVLSIGALAQESVDCINYSGKPDKRCRYARIETSRVPWLYVVDKGMPLETANALRGQEFYVYAPDEGKVGRDTLTMKLVPEEIDAETVTPSKLKGSDWDDVKNFGKVVSSANTGLVNIGLVSRYELHNFRLGTSIVGDATDASVSLVYNFYVPTLKYYDKDHNEITEASMQSYEVGDSMRVYVEAIIPFGPQKDSIDATLGSEKSPKTFYIEAQGESASIEYLDASGNSLKQADGRILLKVKEGKASFVMVANKAVTDGSTFTLNAFPDVTDASGKVISYVLTEPFPGSYEFKNPDLPNFDHAAIYDTDGDGIGDSIATWFSGNTESAQIDTFYYSWPNDDSFKKYGGDVQSNKDKSLYELPDVKVDVQKDPATGTVKAYVCSLGGCAWLQTPLADSIGAAIRTATLLKGKDGAKDTLIISFNKDMDPSWNKGRGFLLNGTTPLDVDSAVSKQGNVWKFVVDSGAVHVDDMIKISVSCGKSDCPDGILTAADGVPTDANNQEVPVRNAGRVLVDNENNGFYDSDGDGRMDSASVGFESPITEEDLKNMDITLYWLDNDGELVAIPANSLNPKISEDGLVLEFKIDDPDAYGGGGIMNMLTGIDKSYSKDGKTEYGYATIVNKISVNGKDTTETTDYNMNDYMSPVISSTFLNPESFQEMEPDKFKITFSEAMDKDKTQISDDCLSFYVDGSWVHYNLSAAEWSDDGRSVTLFMEAGEDLSTRMNPADSVRFDNFTSGFVDRKGNKVSEKAPSVMVEGDPRVIMKTNSFADLNKADELSGREKPFTIDHVKDAKEASDQSSLGVLMDVGFSTIMAQDSAGQTVPNMDEIGLSWELYVYTNLGAYVGGASGKIDCDDPFFESNCLENPDKLYVRWNMRSDKGRRVGAGIYLAKFKVKVYGAKEDFKIERIFRWGISSKRH